MDFYSYNNMNNKGGFNNMNSGGRNNTKNNGFNNTSNSGYNNVNNNGCNNASENGGCDSFQNKFDEYSSMSEKQLYAELANVVNRMKREGTFDVSALENLYATSAPYLNDMQRARMKGIIDMLKSQ